MKHHNFSECATLREAILLLEKKSGKCLCELAAIAGVPPSIMSVAKQGGRITDAYKPKLAAAFNIPDDLFPRKVEPGHEPPIPPDDGAWIPEVRKQRAVLHDIETGRANI